MIRGSDSVWRHVEKMVDGSLKCVFCGKVFAKRTSISRIKYHLAGVKGGGVKQLCEKVTPDVQREAFDNLLNGSKSTWVDSMPMPDAPETELGTEPADQPFEMDRSVPSSSNNEATNVPSTPFRGLAIEQEEQPCLDEATPDAQQAAFDQLPNRMHVSMPSSEMQGQPLLDDGLSWMDSMIGGEIFLADENVAPVMPMPDAPEIGLETEPADQPFEMDMNNIPSSLMRDVEFSRGKEKMTWELMPSVGERGSSSKRPVDRSVPSSSNNEATNAASNPVRALASEQEEQPRLDDGLGGMDIGGETELVAEPRAPDVVMTDEPRTEQAHQSFEMMDADFRMCKKIMSREYKHSDVERGSSSKSPVHKRQRTRRYLLPTRYLEGQAFERNMKDVWSGLFNDEVSCIGIHGMGGVGKTALATHIHNRLHQEEQDIFLHVCWITVSQDFSIEALQDRIAKSFDLDLGDEKDAVVRAGMLLTELTVKKKYVLILDDLWDRFALEKVGIPLRTDGCKLIFTTRSLDICTKMDCQKIIKVEPLSEGEAWNLFLKNYGRHDRLFHEARQIAESVVKECAGLPLGIMTMAGSMKGVFDVYRWRDALRQLRISEVGRRDMETKVFRVLKFSYAQLDEESLQKCFSHITLFPKGKIIWREDLIEYLIDEGIVEEMRRRRTQFDRGHTMLDQLENASLLEGSTDDENYRYVKMHDLIWDMARKILCESHGGRVQAGAQLTELPEETWWRENLSIVSLMENRIKEIPSDFSPRCPNLSTLLLCRNYGLNLVESSFFQHLISLKVLDLSDTDIERLPVSICHLTSLTVLLLGWCATLRYVPSLKKLKALKKLDLRYTGLKKLPKGLKRLKDLRYLNLDGSGVLVLRPGILPELLKLQFLKLHQKVEVFLPVLGHEVFSLKKLETLECCFSDLENFRNFHIEGFLPLVACKVTVGRHSFSVLEDLNYTKSDSEAWFYDLMIDNAFFLSDISFRKVVIVNCQNMRILCPLDRYISLQILHLDGLLILETLFEAPSGPLPLPVFCCLKEIVIHKCHRMKVLIPPRLLSILRLEVIVVEDCHNMGVIMETDEEDRIRQDLSCLQGLKVLVLKKLPNFIRISSGRLECNSLKEITVYDCPQLTGIPLTNPYSLEKIDPPSLWNLFQLGHEAELAGEIQ